MGKKLWLHHSGQARVERRVHRAPEKLGRVFQAQRLLGSQASHACELDVDADGLCTHDRQAVESASQLLLDGLAPACQP